MRKTTLVTLLAAALVVAVPGVADARPPSSSAPLTQSKPQAEPPHRHETLIEVSVLHATRDKKGKDSRIGEMPELNDAPFSSYDSYELLARNKLTLVKGGRRKLPLPNGRLLEARLEDVLPDTSVRLFASINRPGAADFLPLLEVRARRGQSFIVAGQSYKRGILVLVFKVLR